MTLFEISEKSKEGVHSMSEDILVYHNIEDALERPFLNSFSKNIRFGLYIYENIFIHKDELKLSDIVIISLYRKLLELSDGVYILIDHNSQGPANIIARSIVEVYLSLTYITEDKVLMENRALCYFLFHKEEELKLLNKRYAYDLLREKYSETTLSQMKASIKNLKKEHPFKKIEIDKRNLIKKEQKLKKRYVKWYSIYNRDDVEIFSVVDLIEFVGKKPKNNIKDLYALLSLEVHGVNAIKNVRKESKKIFLDNIRGLDNNNEQIFYAIRSLISKATISLITIYEPEKINDFNEFFLKDRDFQNSGAGT